MLYRDSSIATHYTRGVILSVESSHGVRVEGGSTGGIVEAVGDDSSIALVVQQKAGALLTLGSTSGSIQVGNSTTPLLAVQRYVVQFTPAALAANTFAESTITVTGLTTNASLVFTPRSAVTGAYNYLVRCSTAAELKFSEQNNSASTIGTGESTSRGLLTELRY